MTEQTPNRQPAGIPVGGQFATSARAEASGVALCDPAVATDPSTPETFEMLWCEACNVGFDENEAALIYECGNCNTKGTDRKCPDCKKFRARSEEPGCPQCEEPVDENQVEMVHDHDGQVIRLEDYEPDGPTKAERDEAAKIAAAEQAETDRAARLAAKQANVTVVTAADITPGAVLVDPDDDRRFATEAEVLSVRHVETPDGPVVIYKTYDHSTGVIVRRAADPVTTKTAVDTPPTVQRDGTRLSADDFEGIRFHDEFDPDLGSTSSPSNAIEVLIGPAPRDGGTLPVLALVAGRRHRSGPISGAAYHLGRWDDPDQAAAALDVLDRAADALAAARAEHPPSPERAATEAADVDSRPDGWEAVSVSRPDWVGADIARTAQARVGLSNWHEDRGAMLAIEIPGQWNCTITDPAVVKDAVAEARKHLRTLTGIPARPDVVDDKV